NLAMRVRVGNAYDFALVLEDQDVVDLLARAEFDILLPPDAHQIDYLRGIQFRESQVVARAVADDARNACRGPVAVNARRSGKVAWRVDTDARMIVVKYKRARVIDIATAADARGAWA